MYVKAEEGKLNVVVITGEQHEKVAGMFEANMAARGMRLEYAGPANSYQDAVRKALHEY